MIVWQQQCWSLMAAIAVVINGGGGRIELTAPMAALLMVAGVDGSGNDGVFTTASHKDDCHPLPHHPHPPPCPPLDKDDGGVEGTP